VRSKFIRHGRAVGAAPGFLLYANQHGVGTSVGRRAFEAYLAKMRFVTDQPSNNSR
jgi:hypothetical protein